MIRISSKPIQAAMAACVIASICGCAGGGSYTPPAVLGEVHASMVLVESVDLLPDGSVAPSVHD